MSQAEVNRVRRWQKEHPERVRENTRAWRRDPTNQALERRRRAARKQAVDILIELHDIEFRWLYDDEPAGEAGGRSRMKRARNRLRDRHREEYKALVEDVYELWGLSRGPAGRK